MYVITYIQNGKKGEVRIIDTEKEIRTKFFKENKKITSIKKLNPLFQRKATKAEVIATFTALGDMLGAGKKLLESLNAVIHSLNKKSEMIPILTNVYDKVKSGKQLSECLDEYITIFGVQPITMIATGEKAGRLAETLKTVAMHIRKIEEVKKEIYKGLMSPIFTFIVGLIALFISTTTIIPKITKSFTQMSGGKKDSTSIFLDILNSLSWITPVVMGIIAITIVIGIILFKQEQKKAEEIMAQIPLVKALVFYQAYYVVFASLSNMLSVGIRLQDALPIISRSTKLITIKDELNNASKFIESGNYENFADAFKSISTVERTMLETSQEESRIQLNFSAVSDRFYQSYLDKLKIIGPTIKYIVMMFVIGLIILMFMGIMLPYITMMSQVK